MTSRKQLAINQRALYDDAVKNKMFWNATPSFQEFQRRLQNPKYVQTVQANYRAHGRSGDAFDTLSGFRDYFCVSDEDKQDMTQGVGNMIADTKARLAGQQRYNKLKQHQDKQRGRYGRLDLGVKNPLTNDNVVRDDATDTYLTSQGAEYAQEYEAARAQNHIDETGKRYTEAVERGDLPSAFEVRDEDGNYALMEDLGVKPGVHVTEKGKQQQLAGLVNTRKSVEEQYNALYRKLEEDFKRSAPFSLNTHSQYGIDDNDMRLQAYLNSNAQYRRLKAQLHQLDNAIGVGEEAVKGRAEERYVKNAKGMLGYACRDLKSFGASALRGLWNAVSDVSTWDLGLQDLQDNMTLYTTVKKARQKGYKNLNDEERQMLDVAAKTGAYTAENQQYLGRGYKAGNVTGESLPFMVEMALNPASGLGEAVMSKYMRNAIAKYGKEAVRKEAWKYVTKKCGYRVAGDVLGAALMTGTTGSARTLADTYDRLTGDIKSTYDSDGKIVYDGTENEEKGILKAYLKAFGATAIENHSEFVGEYFNPLLKGVGTLTMKGWKKVNAKSANAFLDNLKDMGSTSTAKWLGNLFDKTQWHGTIGEYAEEVVGNIENALLVGDSTLDTKEGTGVFNLDQNIDTFLGVSLMGGFFSTLKTGAYVRDKVKGERKILMQQSLDLDNSIRYALGADPRLSDKWKEWRVALAQGTDEEKKQALKEISENTNGNIKKAMYDYSANAQKLAGMDKATQGAIEDGTITPEQAQRDADIEQAHEEGLAAEGTARHDIQQEHQLKENSLARMLGISAEQLDRMEDEDIESMTGQNDALDTAIYDYQTSRERYQGVIDRATDEVEQAGIDAAHQIDLYTDHSTGQIRPCVIKGNNGKEDYQGYIVNGNIATHPDGAIDVSGSDKMILYFDPETGKIEHGDASTFASLGESADATVARQQAIDEAKQQAAQAQSRDIDGGVGEDGNVSEAMPTFPQSSDHEERNAADFDIGQVVNAETGEVIPVSFEGLAEGENAYLTGGRPDGKTKDRLKVTIVDAEGNVTNRVMKRGNVQVDGRMSAEDFRNAYEEAVSSRMAPEADMNGQENNVNEEGVVDGDAAPSADKAATSEEEGAASEPAVRDKNGNPIYDKMPISATIADLYDGALDDAEIDGFVSAQIAEAEKAVEKMEKKKPKVGTDKAKYLADKKAWEEGLQEAQRKVQYWQDVKAEVEKITTPEDARGYEEELNGDAAQTAYRNGSDAAAYGAREVTAEFMQSGDVKITPESYRKETGFGAAEQRAMVGKISKGGKSIDKLAEDLEVFDRENYNGMYFGGDSSVAKDAILDYLSSPDSRKGVKKMQSEAEREYVEAYEAERDRYYQEKYHMSYEEYLVYSSQEMPELLRKYSNFDEQLFLERYADEIEAALQKREEQLKQEENGKEGNVSAGEESGHGRSNQVQSGERTDDIGRGEVGKDSAGEVGPRHEGVVESEAALGSGETEAGEHPLSSEDIEDGKLSVNDGRGDKGRIGERQGDLAKAGDVDDKSAGGEKEPMSPTPAMIDRMIEEQRVDDVSELLISSELKKAAEGIAEAFGMKVVYLKKVFIKSNDPAVEDFEGNGFVRNGVIYLSLKEADIAQFTFGHELLHQLKQIDADSYMRIRQKVIDVMGRKAFEMEVKARQMTYANVPGYTLYEDYAEEVIADTLGDIITHTDMLPNIARSLKENPSLLDRFLKVVDNVRQYFRGKIGGALGDLVNDIRNTYEMTARQGAELGLSEPRGEREQRAANERFNNELTRYQNGEMDKNEMLHLGRPQGVMRTFLPNLPIVMRQRVIKKGSEKKHEVDVSAIMNMPQHLSSPIFVFQRSEDTIGVLTDMRDRNGKNVCVAIELKRQIQQGAEYLEVNDVRSFHGREFKNIVEPIANNKTLKWVDKEKGLAYLSSASQPVQQEIDKQVLDTATKVVKDFVNPKESDGKDRQFYASLGVSRQFGDGERDGEREQQTANERLKGEGYQYMARDKFSLRLAEAKNNTDKNPSQAQKESGNYRKGHIRFGGYNYTIENPQGSYRSGVDENGKKWKQKMNNTYGYILGTKGKDGDHLDMFINDKADLDSWNGNVYVVDQVLPDGSFDEHKVMYGFDSEEEARKAYLSNYEQGWQGLGNITGVSKEDFDCWLEKSGRKTKAFSEYKNVKSESAESPKTGAFGTVYTQFKGKPQEAIAFLLEKKEGEAVSALHHKDIGDIDLVWGKEGTAKSDGFGLAKLAKYHPEVLGNLQEILDAMVVVKRTDNRVKLESETHQASVRLTWDSEKKNWLLTAFEKKNSVSDNTTDTVGTAEGGKRNDTATPQNTVSDGKDTEKDSSEQEDEEKKASGDRPLYASLGVSRSLGEEAAEGEREATSVRLQNADIVDAEAMAEEYGLDADDVRRYAEGMRKGSSAQAARALAEISRKIIAAHEDEIHSLLDMRKFRKPVEKALKEAFGDVDVLIEERRKQIEEERNTMEAARKRAEEEHRKREARLEELAVLTDEEIDHSYAEALAKGDVAAAREMLDEAARRKGYGDVRSDYQGVGAWSAPSNPDYETDEARRNAVGEDSPDLNVEDMAAGYSNQPEDIFVHPNKYSQGLPTSEESGNAIQTAIDDIRNGKKDVKVKVYRAVPTSVKEGKLRNGDWVTPSRKYAELHGSSRLEGKYRIIEDEVPVSELWWDGNDVNEWGYDNGKGYRYKNVKNNRKLNDLVTRDDNGNVIPPSKRFNQRKADERFQRGIGGVKPSKAEAVLRDAVIDRLRENGMEVITDVAEGQKVLDEANGKGKLQMGDAPETFAERLKQAVENRGVVMPGLNETYVEVVKDIPRHGYTGTIAEATREAIDAAKRKYAGKELTYNNYGVNFNYTISANAIEICLSPKHQNLSANKGIHLALAEHLEEVINNSIEVEEHPDYVKNNGTRGNNGSVNTEALMHRFYGVAVIDGTPFRIMTLMREGKDSATSNGIHSYAVQKIEVLDNDLPSTSNGVGSIPQVKSGSLYPLAKLLKGVEKAYDKGKYLLEESKKRSAGLREQRVYHGSGADGLRFFRTANGEAYGFTVGGKIYVDPRIATSETPVHEYAHLWATALRSGNAEEWQNVVGLMKDSKVWDEVKKRYPELKTDDEIADEVIATYSGQRGAERLREEQRKIAEGNGGVFEKAEAISALESVKRALKMFWKGVADFLHIHYKSAEEVADRVMKDLLEGVDPRKMGDGVDRQRYASIGVSRSLGEEAGEGEPRYASLGLSEQQLDGDDTIRFSLRQEPAPKVTKKGYAVFIYKKLKNGGYKLVPKMLSNDPGAPAQTWLNADTGYMKRDENGEPLQNTNGRASVSVNGSQAGGNKSNKLAWRPGKHLAMYPNASQFKSPDGTIPKDVIFFEVEYAADPDLHKQYQRNAWELGMNDNGQYRNNQGGLPYIPKDSYYLYRTNSISEGATPMIITGAYKINRALTDAEAKELNQNAGGMWCPRKGGDLTEEKLKDMGLDDKGLKKMTESFDMDTIKESHDESDEARLLPGYKSREINWEDKDLIHSIEENGQDINDYRDGYVAPEHSEEPTIRFSLDKDKGTVVSPSKPSKAEAVLRDAVIDRLRENGMEVITDVAEGQKVLDEANGEEVMLSAKQKRALETATMADESTNKATVVSSADGAKVQNNLEILADSYKNRPNKAKGFITDLSRSLGLEQHEASQYGTFVTENGKTVTIRVSNHNARVSFFDKNGENDGISIVISNHKNKGLLNDGNAHIIEFFYSKQSLQRADSKPLSDIIRSVSEALYSGEFKDTTGLAERQEVNAKQIREQRMGGADGLRFFRTANGEAYGFTVGGKIYVDPRIATSETPVHEYAHLWATALRSGNKEEWQNVVGLMKDSKVWDEVKGRYPELKTDDEIADEVIATYSGLRGAERLREEQRKIAEGDGGVFEKAEAISALEKVKLSLKRFWKGVADFLHIHYKSAEEVADRVMKDLLEGVDPRKKGDGVDRQRYASLGVSRSLGEEAGEGEPRWASSSLSEQQLDGDDTIRFSLNYDKWDREMASWLKRNRLPKNAQRPVVPQREAGESDLHFAGRLAKYNQDKALWNTAPKYEGHLSSGMTARGEFNYELQRGSVLARIAAQDSMLAIRKAQEAIARHSGLLKVGTFEDAYMAENNSHGKAKNEFEQYDQEYLEPLRKWFNVMMKRLDGSYNNVTNYMIAKHGLERNAHMAFMAALEAEAKKAIGNTQPDAKRLRAQMVHDAYRQYKADSRRLINDADYEAGKYDYAQWRRTDDAIRKSYCSNYESFRYDKGWVVRDYAGLSSLFQNETDFEEKAAELCADIESKNGHETSELWDAVRQATRQILKNSHDAGMMSDETYDYVRGMYEHYIPLRGWNDSAADEVWDYAGGGRGVFNAALKEAHGRQSLADDPVAYIMNMAESGFLVNNRNWVKQHFLTMAMNHPTDLLTVSKAWYVKTKDQFGNEVWIPASPNIPADETDPAVIEAALNAFQTKMEQMEQSGDATQQRGSLNIEYPQTKSEEREHEVRVMKDGEEYVVYVNGDPQLAQALNNTRAMRVREHEGNFEKACAWLGRKMAAVYTSLSPLFVPSNWARDTTMTLASTAIREDARYNWLLRTKFMRPDVQMRMFGLVKEYQNGKLREKVKSNKATKMEENFWNFMINGGETGFVSTMDVDAFREKIQRDLKDMGRTRLNPVKVGHTIADSVEYINRVIEDSNRFAIYQTSIEYGRGIEEAVQDAKNVTLNFNRKGTGEMGMSAIRQLYLFINPAIQSLQTLGALAKDHKAKFTAVTSAWMASGMLVPLFNELMFNLASAAAGGGGDDDDEFNPKDEYWKFSSFDRRNNCILWIPFTHDFIKIPLAQEFRGFYGIGDMVASAMWGGENAKESWSNYAADLMGQIIDLSPLDPVSYDGNVLVSLMPNAIRPLVEIAQNVTFTGKPIYRESDFNKYDPSFKKAYAGTPDFLLRYSKWMNSIGNKYPEAQQGPVEQTAVGRYANNPAVIDHLLKSYLGGMYTLGSQIAGAITKASDEETRKDFKTADIPFFSKFVANPNDRPQSKNKGDAYWQDFEKYQRSSHTLGVIRQDARKTGNFSVLEDFYKSEEYKEMKEYEPKAKQRKEEQKYERWKEEGNADLYQPHQQTGEDVYKRHSTPADDFEDTKASILYQKIKPAKDIFDLADVNTPSGMDTFNKYYDLAGKVEEAHSVKKEMNAIVKSFVDGEHKATFDPEKMKEYRALRKQYVQLVEEGNRMFEKIKAQRN
jgi:hypothetical protein